MATTSEQEMHPLSDRVGERAGTQDSERATGTGSAVMLAPDRAPGRPPVQERVPVAPGAAPSVQVEPKGPASKLGRRGLPLPGRATRPKHRLRLGFLLYRFRYLLTFIVIGFVSIVCEIALVHWAMSDKLPWLARASIAFVFGLLLSFALNATFNFRVPRRDMLRAFLLFAGVSCLSFGLNMGMVTLVKASVLQAHYGEIRLVTSALLFALSYSLHRRFTFSSAKNYGLAVYAAANENVDEIYRRIGDNCDHVHVDLIDQTRKPDCAPVDLDKIRQARAYWPDRPFCMHIMSTQPRRWIEQTWDDVDWYVVDVDADDDLIDVLWRCRLKGKKVGVVWHAATAHKPMLHYLAHVDFVLVLGIDQPGRSGQKMSGEAVEIARTLDAMRSRYDFEIIFDGGVTVSNVRDLPAKYVVAASAVLNAENPVAAAYRIMTGARYES
ncbi:MAG: GtrA family protein [Planctomycetota bacterium]|nr:GtrA family protein [Planctomycetota bacterium]